MEGNLLKIFKHFGSVNQRKKLCEEFMELQDELYVNYLLQDEDYENLLTEIADVLVLIMQFAYAYGFSKEDIEEEMKIKIIRTLERLENGYYEK